MNAVNFTLLCALALLLRLFTMATCHYPLTEELAARLVHPDTMATRVAHQNRQHASQPAPREPNPSRVIDGKRTDTPMLALQRPHTTLRDSLEQLKVENTQLHALRKSHTTLIWLLASLLLIVSIAAGRWQRQLRLAEASKAVLLEQNRYLRHLEKKAQTLREKIQRALDQKFHPPKGNWAIPLRALSHISSNGNLITFHAIDGTTYHMWGSLSALQEVLPPFLFARCYQSYIVNLTAIKEVQTHALSMQSGTHIKIGRSYKKSFLAAWNRFIEA